MVPISARSVTLNTGPKPACRSSAAAIGSRAAIVRMAVNTGINWVRTSANTWRNPRSPGHLGDVPHTWIGAEYVLSFRSMLVYERPSTESLVLFAGVPASWLDEGEVGATGLPTHYGALDLNLRRDGESTLVVSVSGDLEMPPGGIVLRPPLAGPLVGVEVNGRPITTFDAESATIDASPAHVVLRT